MSDDFATEVAALAADIPTLGAKTAVYVGRSGVKAIVNIGTSSVALPFIGMSLPPAGHPVQLELRNDQLVVTGPARPLPGIGKITQTGSPRATVTAWGETYTLPMRSGYTPALNDDVDIAWTADGGVIQGKLTAVSNVAPPTAAPAPSTQVYHPDVFLAEDSASYKGGWWTGDVYSSDGNDGAWFYFDKIKDSIPDNAVIKLARIYLNPRQEQGDPPLLQLHTSSSRPGGTVSYTGGTVALGQRSGWVDIPGWMIDFLKVNPGGLGFNNGGYSIFRGIGADRLSGALDLAWEA